MKQQTATIYDTRINLLVGCAFWGFMVLRVQYTSEKLVEVGLVA